MPEAKPTLNTRAAVTRSLLGWGVVAGPFYLVIGIVLGLTRPGFEFSQHALSLLTLGDLGWIQRLNLALSGLMVLAAALGIFRAIRNGRGLAMAALTGVYGLALIASAVFLPDAVDGFPPGATAQTTTHGILHIVCGALGFIALAAAAFTYPRWARHEGVPGARDSTILGAVIVVGFMAGAALAQNSAGIALLWIAVLAGWLWLALACARIYKWSPHPLAPVEPPAAP